MLIVLKMQFAAKSILSWLGFSFALQEEK